MQEKESRNNPVDKQAFLDEVFERALEAFEDGAPIELDDLVGANEDLRANVENLIEIARQVGVGPIISHPNISGYIVLREIGRGGMGAVYLAKQDSLNRLVALKVLPHAATLAAGARSRFEKEAHALARVRHPNVVAVHHVVQDPNVYAYAMEYIHGHTLGQLIDLLRQDDSPPTVSTILEHFPDNELPDRQYAHFMARIVLLIGHALGAVHRAGLLHRDIKPSNIMIRPNGQPILTDFGLVLDVDSTVHTKEGQFVGTLSYAAPEQIRGERDSIDARTDIYALGATLYHALCLQRPFKGVDGTHVLNAIERYGPPAFPKNRTQAIPRDLITIVQKAMEPDPTNRYASADDMADDLQRFLDSKPIKARRASIVARTVKFSRRHRGFLMAGAVGGIIASLALLVLALRLLVLPGWVDSKLLQAQETLLNPRFTELVWAMTTTPSKGDRKKAVSNSASYFKKVTHEYQETMGRFELFGIRLLMPNRYYRFALEKDITTIAFAILNHNDIPVESLERIGKQLPSLVPIIQQLRDPSSDFSTFDPKALSYKESRALGLLSYLCAKPSLCVRVWGARPHRDVGPLLDAALAQSLMTSSDPMSMGRALMRIDRAARAFPDSLVLKVIYADIAVRAGELGIAEDFLNRLGVTDELLDKLGTNETSEDPFKSVLGLADDGYDPFKTAWRAKAMLCWKRGSPGDLKRARILYAHLSKWSKSPEVHTQYRSFLVDVGDLDMATTIALRLVQQRPTILDYRKPFIEITEQWWASLEPSKREEARGDDSYRERFGWYKESVRLLSESDQIKAVPPPSLPLEPPLQDRSSQR